MACNSHPSPALAVPGHRAPGVGVESPFELLAACHDRVRRSLDLLQRLQTHVARIGCDKDARSAAQDVLRYFDLAAPLHHQDEELHVFPPLLASADTKLHAHVRKLQAEHLEMEKRWQSARQVLQEIAAAADNNASPLHAKQLRTLNDFSVLYADHIENEELRIYPAAIAVLSPQAVDAMGAEMGVRRGLPP